MVKLQDAIDLSVKKSIVVSLASNLSCEEIREQIIDGKDVQIFSQYEKEDERKSNIIAIVPPKIQESNPIHPGGYLMIKECYLGSL